MRILLLVVSFSMLQNFFAQQPLFLIKGKVFCDKHPGETVPKAIITINTSEGLNFSIKTDSTGSYAYGLKSPTGSNVQVSCGTDKYSHCNIHKDRVFLTYEKKYHLNLTDTTTFVCDFTLTPVSACRSYPDIIFKKNSIECDTVYESGGNEELIKLTENDVADELVAVLKAYPKIILQVSAHCSRNEKNTDALSTRRAEKIVALLVSKGIDKRRLIPKGYGIKHLKIPDEMIKKMKTQEEKDALHAKNRRVVFKVLSWDFLEKDAAGK
jgi:hypothetical protein